MAPLTERQIEEIVELAQECERQTAEAMSFQRRAYVRTASECRRSAAMASTEAFQIAQEAQ